MSSSTSTKVDWNKLKKLKKKKRKKIIKQYVNKGRRQEKMLKMEQEGSIEDTMVPLNTSILFKRDFSKFQNMFHSQRVACMSFFRLLPIVHSGWKTVSNKYLFVKEIVIWWQALLLCVVPRWILMQTSREERSGWKN